MKIGYLMQAGVPDMRKQPLSGAANHVKHVFEELGSLGYEVRLLAVFDGQIWKSDDLSDFEPVAVRWFDRRVARLFESGVRRFQAELKLPYFAAFDSLRFAQACRQELADCDLFFERLGWMGYGGGLVSHWLNIPLVYEVNGDHLDELAIQGIAPKGVQRQLSIALMKRAAQNAAAAVATGDGWRQRHIERWQLRPDSVVVVENGTEVVERLQREQLRSFHGAGHAVEAPTLIYLGGLEPWHGVPVLLRALARTAEQAVDVQLVIVGSGANYKQIEELAVDLGVKERVTMTGHLSVHQFVERLAEADIGVSPYCGRVEFSGLKLLDYKAAGLAIIASGQDGQPSVLQHERTALIVPPCDEEALADAIVQLSTNAAVRKCLGQAARIEAEQQHSWRHTASQLSVIFEQFVEADSADRRPE